MSYQGTSSPEAKAQRRPNRFYTRANAADQRPPGARRDLQKIAAIIGVTVGPLRVTCSRLGISLQRPRVKLLPPRTVTSTAIMVGAAGETPTLTICMKYKGQELNTPLPLTPSMISQFALEACCRDQKMGELAKDLLEAVIAKGLFQELLGE